MIKNLNRCLLAALVSIAAASAAEAQSGWIEKKANKPAALDEALERNARVRVIVALEDPRLTADDVSAAGREAIRKHQMAVLNAAVPAAAAALTEGNAIPYAVHLMASIPSFAVNVDQAELQRLASDPRVRSIEIDEALAHSLAASTKIIGMYGAWKFPYTARGKGRSIAVLDTGVSIGHKFLAASRIVTQACFSGGGDVSVTLCPNGQLTDFGTGAGDACSLALSDSCAHGTHVAGIAAGANTNLLTGEPRRGVAFQSGIVAVQVFSESLTAAYSDLLAALDWLRANQENIRPRLSAINLSLGGGAYEGSCDTVYPSMTSMMKGLTSDRVAVVVASGNQGHVDKISFPACISSAVAVGATTKSAKGERERIASYSNMGSMIDLIAPGGDSAYPTGSFDPAISSSFPGGKFASWTGTSMATPHVAGAFAAIRSAPGCGAYTVAQIVTTLRDTGLSIKDHRVGAIRSGKRISVREALDHLGCTAST